ncbi:MAG: hypothetical protein LBK47_07295 [Prevotellaceae bacterium]|nr:hypothetical protein [Prevotellaceae bacterium]
MALTRPVRMGFAEPPVQVGGAALFCFNSHCPSLLRFTQQDNAPALVNCQ